MFSVLWSPVLDFSVTLVQSLMTGFLWPVILVLMASVVVCWVDGDDNLANLLGDVAHRDLTSSKERFQL